MRIGRGGGLLKIQRTSDLFYGVGVNPRGPDISLAQQFLNGADVEVGLQEVLVLRVRMAESMGRVAFGEISSPKIDNIFIDLQPFVEGILSTLIATQHFARQGFFNSSLSDG